MKLKKKLPRYWLGTRKPTGLGYQPNRGIGDTTFNALRGISVQPEANAMRQNQIPNALNRLMSGAQYPMLMLLNMTFAGTSAAGAQAANSIGSSILSNSASSSIKSLNNLGKNLTNVTSNSQAALNAVGKAAGVLGTAYGLYNVGNDIFHANDTISLDLIANSAATNTITTAGGNTYTERGGIDSKGVIDYQRLMDTQKKVNLAIDTAALGATIGSFFTPLGTVIGGGAGLALGAIADLLGFGESEEEAKQKIRNQEDVFAMSNRLNRSAALDADTKAEFYDRAENGKRPVWTPAGLIGKKATARVSNGEVVGNFEEGIATRIPGLKNNKDTKLAALKDGDFVISNKYGLSDYAAATGDYAGALNLLEMLMGMRNSKGYKNGKLPGLEGGGIWNNILGVLPHFVSLAGNWSLYNRAKEADVSAPDIYIDNPEGTKAVNELAQLRFDADPYYREALRGLNWANYNARRDVGLGPGGRAIAQATNYTNYLRGLGDITKMYNEALNSYAEKYAAALANLGSTNQGRRMEAAAKKHAFLQLAMGQRESWIAQYRKNIDLNLLNAAAEYMRQGQYLDSLATQNKMLKLYETGVETDRMKMLHDIGKSIEDINRMYIPTSTQLYFYPTSEMQMRRAMGYKNGKLPRCEDGLVDTRSDTTYQGYNPNPIPWGAGLGPAGQGPITLLEGLEEASQVSNNPYLQTGIAPSPMSKAKRIYDRARALNRLNNRKMLAGDLMGTPEWWEKYYDKALPFIGAANLGAAGYAGYRLLKDDAERAKKERSKQQKK